MKHLIFKSSFHEKLKVLIIPMMLLTLGVGQMWATYYYRGEKNSWSATAMTNVNGIYSYYSASAGAHQFKISTSTTSHDYNYTYVTAGYKNTDVSDIGDYSKDNCYCWRSGAHYILIFNPNTSVNSTSKPIICAATALPSAGFETEGNTISYYNNVDGDKQSSALDRENGTTIDLTSKAITDLYLKAFNTKMYQHYEVNLLDKTAYHFYYKIHRTAESAGSTGFTEVTSADGYSAGSVNWGSFDGSKYRKPTYYVTANQSLLTGLGSGLYTMSYYFTHVGTTETYRLPSTSSKYNELKWKIPVPAVTDGAVTSNGTGSGTSGSPFSVADGNTITFTASGSQASTDANSVLYVKWGSDSYAPASSTTKTITPTTTKQSMTVKLKYYNSTDDLSGAETTLTIYYQSTLTPSIGISSISPSPANSGDEVTITASRQNAGTANITYQYSTNGSTWTTIGSATSSISKTWTVPASTSTTTYYFRAQMTYEATTYTSATTTLKTYGKKTIKVKNTNGWASMLMHRWGGDKTGTSWPGESAQISAYGSGQWKQVVLYSSNTSFIFVDGTNNDNKNSDQTYAGVSDGGCYEIASGTGTLALNFTANCPAKPSVSVSAATNRTNNAARINGNISSNGNDNITDYGFYWSKTYTTAADLQAHGTKVQKGTSNYTGDIYQDLSSLTASNTIYYIVYATNGQGTQLSSVESFVVPYKVTISKSTGCNTISPSAGTYYYTGGFDVTATRSNGYTFNAWSKTNGNLSGASTPSTGTNKVTFTPTADNATITATYTETTHTVTLGKSGNGHVEIGGATVTSVSGVGIATASGTITAVPDLGYYFTGWTGDINNGVTLASGTASSTSITIRATADSKTITANFAPIWYLKGDFNSWGETHPLTLASSTSGSVTLTTASAKLSNQKFKIWNKQTDKYYQKVNHPITRAANTANSDWTEGGTSNDMKFTSDVIGNYTFAVTLTSNIPSALTVTYPTVYTVTFGKGTGGSSVSASATSAGGSFTSGSYVASGDVVTFSQTALAGYTFKGWYTTVDGNTSAGVNGSNQLTINGTKTVYAQYNPKNYIITLDVDEANKGDISGATTSHSVTYNTTVANIPNLPTAANGYAFVGYYTDHNGAGTKLFNSDGSCIASVSGYTDANKKWIRDDNSVKLYAYYKKSEVTAITLSPAGVGTEVTVTATATIDPTPCGTTIVCWRLLRDNDTEISTAFTPVSGTPAAQTAVSFTSPATSAYYKLEAKLRTGSSCGSGTVLNTYVKRFQVAGTHTVTVNYTCGSEGIKASTSVTANPNEWSDDITAPDIFGYTFARWDAGTGVTIKDGTGEDLTTSTSATIKIKATYNGTLTAVYTQKNIVYFKDNLGWTDPDDPDAHIYVNLLQSDYWNDDRGSGNYDRPNRNLQMDRVPGTTDVFYYEYGNEPTSNYISFTKESMGNSGDFYQAAPNVAHVVFPSRSLDDLSTNKATGLGFYAQTPMFVPLANQTPVKKNSNRAEYYNDGYWTKYLPGTGYSLDIYQSDGSTHVKTVAFTSADELMPMKVVTDLEGNHTYKFQLKRDGDVYYGNGGTMTYTDHGQNTPWEFNNSPFSMCTIVTNAAGDYTFNLSFSPNSGGTNNRLRMEVDYPVASGDYRLIYDDDVQANYKTSAIIPKKNNSTAIVSFFVRKNSSNPILRIQQATVANDGTITWNEYPTSGTPTNQITGSIASAITKDSVYNFNLSMNGSGALSVTSAEYYSGNFYIRTDCANSKWDNYRTDPDHLMTYSEYSITHGGYSHYYAHWVDASEAGRKNVKFCIANDYSPSISDTLARETASGEWAKIANYITEGGDLIRNANVRFMWNKADNTIKRAYIDGAQDNIHSFLELLSADGKIKDKDEPETLTEVSFSDNENWIYEANIKAQPNAQIKLKSTWGESNVIEQYFVGTSSTTETLIGGSGDVWYDIRLLYDFKTNRLVAAYKPSGEISTDMEINADVMFIREAQDDIDQLTFTGSGAVKDIKTAYGVMKFSKWTLNNKSQESGHAPLVPELSPHERGNFYISFPFRVKLNEVFGFGTYGTHWVIQYYDGAKRAREGYWAESSGFWTFVWDRKDFVLEPNVGYLLLLDLDLLGESSDVWGPNSRSEQIELFFPSYGDMPDLTGADVTVTVPAHECKIDKSKDDKGNPTGLPDTDDPRTSYNRKVFDSHWNIMGVPTYVNTDDVTFANTTWTATKPSFLYTWNMGDNSLSVRSGTGFEYHAMHSYIVQYYGDVTWAAKSGSAYPSSVVARRTYMDKPRNVEFRLEVQQNEKMVDQTFVKLSDEEEVSAGFSFDEDMTKIFNSRNVNIYTFVENMKVAGNTMPMDFEKTTIIPVGVEINADGEYTFSVPDGTEGVGLTLIDNVRGMRTNLALTDYMVELEAGTYDDRFVLEISPIEQIVTGVEMINGENGDATLNGVSKKLIDGVLYIIKDGKVFDARGARIQ